MADVRRSEVADAKLAAIFEAIDARNPAAADRLAEAFDEKYRTLARFPEIGPLSPEIGPGFRITMVKPSVLMYRLEGKLVRIHRVLDARMDLPSRMLEDPDV